ncbi:two-component system sensor histidine kinase CiaH [Enterococcus sp. PF1-24]|uniref:sensor histidine kinase n=1 Tax=unclassified Enterococcus TaxID=2608891 RepID=UPI002476219C|nr:MULTISPECIES: HAMP domain-containing sensor histidine kinase [unclassified Enterococcus]MDH6363316.1 two-component system sensor histidine kinase CiaH [Enterococcus sp. PFB1-1]MDH6400383.1 two-component system sensor histidine kinase CiaH [Enterococcus sp. PF1-24]
MEKQLKKQQWKFFIQNFIAFASLFICLGLIIFQLLQISMYQDVDNQLLEMSENDQRLEEFLRLPNPTKDQKNPQIKPPSDFQIQFILRASDGTIVNEGDLGNRIKEYQNLTWSADNLDEVKTTTITAEDGGKLIFRTLTKELSAEFQDKYEPVSYLQLIVNTNQLEDTIQRMKWLLIICMFFFFAVAVALSFWLSQKSIQPIHKSLQQQQLFVSDASHELRSPLTIIQSKLELLLTKPYEQIIDESENIAVALNETQRLTQLTSDLLTLTQSDAGGVQLVNETLDLPQFLLKVVEPYQELAVLQEKVFEFGELLPMTLTIDEKKLHQVLVTLLDNALKYTQTGDKIALSVEKYKEKLRIKLADTGCGISRESQPYIFNRFYREDQSRNRKTGGYGLGLAIAKELVEMQQGQLLFQENNPKGSIFIIELNQT